MSDSKSLHIVRSAMFAALILVATFIIKIPTPGTGGYIHPGDAFVILSGVILGPLYGGAAAAVGSALADILGGYFIYAPITFLIKGICALGSGFIFRKFRDKIKKDHLRVILCGVFSTIIVAGGYLVFELFIYGKGAIASVPANLVQGLSGLVISSLLYPLLIPRVKKDY